MLGAEKQLEHKMLKICSYTDGVLNREYKLDKKRMLVGRFEGADISIDSPHISHYHAFIIMDNSGGGKIIDLESDNGFYVNGEKGKDTYFSQGDIIKFGEIEFHVSEFIGRSKIQNRDEKSVVKLNETDDKQICELPPIENLVIIDGEYCDIKFNENHYKPQNTLELLDTSLDFSEYIDTSKPVDYVPIQKENRTQSMEVCILSNGNIISINYLAIKNKTYYISNNVENEQTILLDCIKNEGRTPLLNIKKNKIKLFKIAEFDCKNLSTHTEDPFEDNEVITFNNDDIITFTHMTVQVIFRLVGTPPTLRLTPFFGRDRSFKLHVTKYVSLIMSIMLLLLFVDIKDTKLPPEKKVAVIYKRAAKPVEKKMPKSFEKQMDTGEKQEDKKVEQKAQKSQEKPTSNKKRNKPKVKPKVNKAPKKAPMKAYKFKMKKSLASLFSSKSVSKLNLKKSKRKLLKSSFDTSQTANDAVLSKKSKVKIGKMGDDFAGKYDRSYGTKGIASKDGFDSTYIEPKTVVLGSMDPEVLRKILKEYLPQFRHCYQEELMEHSEAIKGVVDLNFTIGKNGKVKKANILSKHAKFSRRGVNCMTGVLKIINFPKPKGGGVVDVRQPLNFSSERVNN